MATVENIEVSVNVRGCKELADLVGALVEYQAVLPAQVVECMGRLEQAVGADQFYDRAIHVAPIEVECDSLNAEAIARSLKTHGAINGR